MTLLINATLPVGRSATRLVELGVPRTSLAHAEGGVVLAERSRRLKAINRAVRRRRC
jgi:hypothetical protein